ncbi:MAG: hypothetical protein GY849_14600 [Deltaproteobacteria bacterium]|nr:hypothetical protein [Deltaproteobacteria bacterium]
MKDLRISPDTEGDYDLILEDGKFVWAKDGTQVANHCQIRMSIPRGTLSLNDRLSNKEELGLQLYEIILRADIGKAEKELEIKRVIMETPGYKSLISFSSSQTAHSITYEAHAQTEWGEITIGDTIESL